MKMNLKRVTAVCMSLMMIASGLAVAPEIQAKAKLSVPKKVTVKAGKSKTMKITAKGYTVKKVKCVSEAKNVTLKTTKKSITVKAKKGTGGMSDFLVTTIKAKKGKKTQSYTFYTNVTITGKATITTKHIKTLAELKKIDAGNNRMKYVIDNDIDMTGWTEPIASMKCSIDGKNHELKNMNSPLVGKVYGGTIENIAFNVKFTSIFDLWGDKYVAPIGMLGGGDNDEIATVKMCKTTGTINCSVGSDYTEDDLLYVGGVVGGFTNNGCVENCKNEASIKIYGFANAGIGGIVGVVGGRTGAVAVKECANYGDVESDTWPARSSYCGVGGVLGYGCSASTAKDCLNRAKVAGSSRRPGGGLVGSGDQRLENCVSIGQSDFGVFGGEVDKMIVESWNYSADAFKNVYYDSNNCDGFNWKDDSIDVEGVIAAGDILNQNVFKGLDFDNVWMMNPLDGPELQNVYA